MASEKVKLSAPWVLYVDALRAMFEEDPEVTIDYDDETNVVRMRVDNQVKADALSQLIPAEKDFGNVKLKINVVPANMKAKKSDLFMAAFAGNNAVNGYVPIEGVFSNPLMYVMFKKEVVQYWIDNMGDPRGLRSTLYEDIAREVFGEHEGVLFCTDSE